MAWIAEITDLLKRNCLSCWNCLNSFEYLHYSLNLHGLRVVGEWIHQGAPFFVKGVCWLLLVAISSVDFCTLTVRHSNLNSHSIFAFCKTFKSPHHLLLCIVVVTISIFEVHCSTTTKHMHQIMDVVLPVL